MVIEEESLGSYDGKGGDGWMQRMMRTVDGSVLFFPLLFLHIVDVKRSKSSLEVLL